MAFSEKGYSMQAAATQEDVSIDNSQQRRENSITRDEDAIARFGKKQQLRRNFGLLSMTGLTCTLMITWEGTLRIPLAGGQYNWYEPDTRPVDPTEQSMITKLQGGNPRSETVFEIPELLDGMDDSHSLASRTGQLCVSGRNNDTGFAGSKL
ncbi:MAG: hypothetical protein Q9191_001687 [Dirinaria sp. TL-2023a]